MICQGHVEFPLLIRMPDRSLLSIYGERTFNPTTKRARLYRALFVPYRACRHWQNRLEYGAFLDMMTAHNLISK